MPTLTPLDSECKKTQITWPGASSCAPLKKTMIECLGYDGEWYPMPTVSATATALTVNDNGFHIAPFNLPAGGKVYCHVRSASKWDWGIWTPSNDAYSLPNCNPVVAVIDPIVADEEEE